MLRVALLILGWGFATAACLADQDEIDPAKTAAIRELLEITGAQANRTALTRTFTQQLVSVLQANKTELSTEAIAIIESEVDQVVGEQLKTGELQRKMYGIYARYFSLEEIQGLIAFNRSDIGKKANRVMPILMRESMTAAQQWSEEIGPDLSRRVSRRLKDEGIRIGR